MSGGQTSSESQIFHSKETVSVLSHSSKDSKAVPSGKSGVEKDNTAKESNQISDYVLEYKKEVEKKFANSKANANFKLKRKRKPGASKVIQRSTQDYLKTEENKMERISTRKTNKENLWAKKKKAREVKVQETSFEMIGKAEIITQAKSSMENFAKLRIQNGLSEKLKRDKSGESGQVNRSLRRTKMKMTKEIISRIKAFHEDKISGTVSPDSVKTKNLKNNLFVIEKSRQVYNSLESAKNLGWIDLRAQKVKSDLNLLRKKYILKKKKARRNKTKVGSDKDKDTKTTVPNLESWRVTRLVLLLARLDRRHLESQLANKQSLLHRELIDAVLRLVGTNIDFTGLFRQAIYNEDILRRYRPGILEKVKRLSSLEFQLRKKPFCTQEYNENLMPSMMESLVRSSRNRDFSSEHIRLIRSKELLIPPDNLSCDKSRPSSLKVHKTKAIPCLRDKKYFNLLNRGKMGINPSRVSPNFMSLSGVNKKPKKKTKKEVKRIQGGLQRRKTGSQMWEEFVMKNMKTKIKKLNILKRERGNNYSININNNNYNNNINLFDTDMVMKPPDDGVSPKKVVAIPTFKKQAKKSQKLDSKQIRSKHTSLMKKGSKLSKGLQKKNHSLKAKSEYRKKRIGDSSLRNEKDSRRNINLDLRVPKKPTCSSFKMNSKRILHLKNKKQNSSNLRNMTKKQSYKDLRVNKMDTRNLSKLHKKQLPKLALNKSKYMLAAGYFAGNCYPSKIKSDRQNFQANADSLNCKAKKKMRSQCINTSRRFKDSRSWLVSEDKISNHSRSILRLKEKFNKKTDFYKLNSFLKKIKQRTNVQSLKKRQKSKPSKKPASFKAVGKVSNPGVHLSNKNRNQLEKKIRRSSWNMSQKIKQENQDTLNVNKEYFSNKGNVNQIDVLKSLPTGKIVFYNSIPSFIA